LFSVEFVKVELDFFVRFPDMMMMMMANGGEKDALRHFANALQRRVPYLSILISVAT